MHFYQFQALNLGGRKIYGTISAYNYADALKNLKQKNLHPIRLNVKNFRFVNKRSVSWITEWSLDMSFLLKQGLSLPNSLEISKLRLNKNQRQFIDMIVNELHSGLTLSQIFSKYPSFPKLLINLLGISESAGQYAQAFEDYASIKREETDFFDKLKTNLQYPLILTIILFAMIILFSEFLLPTALDFFKQNNFEQPLATLLFISFATMLKSILHIITDLPSIITIMVSIYLIAKIKRIRFFLSWVIVTCPVFGKIYLLSSQYFYLKNFSMLLKMGYHVIQSANYCAETLQNTYLKNRIQKITSNIKQEGKISKELAKQLKLPDSMKQLLLMGENTTQLPLYSDICAQTLKTIYQQKLQKIIAWTGPILISIIGLGMVWMVIAFVAPLYDQIARLD